MKKAVIVSCFDNYSYEVRTKYIEKVLRDMGYRTVIVAGDFDHRNKVTYHVERDGLKMIHVPTYKRNLSVGRIYSHYIYGHKVERILRKIKPELVYAITPPNFEFSAVSNYKKKAKRDAKVVYDVVDMWPETLPVTGMLKKLASPFLSVWKSIRNKALPDADGILYECNLFRDTVNDDLGEILSKKGVLQKRVYFCKKDSMIFEKSSPLGRALTSGGFESMLEKGPDFKETGENQNSFKIIYLGAINNITDIELIGKVIAEIAKRRKVVLHFIGNGEGIDTLKELTEAAGARFINHGIVYDEYEKARIMGDADAALNIMKETVYIGATMKSLDYFSLGIPVINSVKGDTAKLMEEYGAGVSVSNENYKNNIRDFLSKDKNAVEDMRKASRRLFLDNFEEEKIEGELAEFFEMVL